MKHALRLLLVLTITLGILAPRASAIAMELMPGQFQTIVICSGFEMQTIVIDAEGQPVEVADTEAHKCVFKDAVVAIAVPETPVWQTLARANLRDAARADLVSAPLAAVLPPPSQGPPLPV
ncbi:hypothetical protein PM03_12385 [Thalassobacter stenotrophicus]|uniref:hypothetical protein n=1 Tax=Thalassobacter TaxID=266808 RepID=UPI00051DA96A|nr:MULTISPECIES: hypothetical protein [Thalassobacter]KGK78795.1 hypothetical protein PM03_12385 [Thalassobacter stenotrophicus]KGL00880.1 hypothetical protein PM04_11935 [Thalassobacter sp. 16PALIMAR09]